MAFTNTNNRLAGRQPTIFPAGSEVVAQRDEIALVPADLDVNNAGAVSILPAGCVLVGITYDSDSLDAGATTTISASVGVMNAADSDLATVLASTITASRNGTAVHLVTPTMLRLAASTSDRKIGVKFTSGAATRRAGTVGLTLHYRAA